MPIPKLAPYSMDAFRASSGNNEYTRLLFIKKFITIKFKDDICHIIIIWYVEYLWEILDSKWQTFHNSFFN